MSQKHIVFSTAAALLFAVSNAQAAAPTAELKVTGTLTVPTCSVASAEDGVYNIGKVSGTLVSATANTKLAEMNKTWTITCDAETYLNFKPVDNRAATASATGTANFGLGNVNTTGKIGFYNVTMKNGLVDGKTTTLFSAPATSFTASSSVTVDAANRNGWAAGNSTQKSGRVFVADLAVTPTLANTTTMGGAITDDTDIDGSLTLNFAYGI
ncbi:MAG: DUF1120 domain-containing protein [Neisseriaceae bacterium]|nr:DUF1120 domain-containing protein [Neisseriaceae bacterium]MBP6861268.1 DUF1120 domain-containing protein [Neisseriaceae bacterium]